jgi:hypothetical protein
VLGADVVVEVDRAVAVEQPGVGDPVQVKLVLELIGR